jgi:hypothetical protein
LNNKVISAYLRQAGNQLYRFALFAYIVGSRHCAALPREWVASLEQAIFIVDFKLVFALIEKIRPANAVRRNAISSCIDNFEYDKILSLITESKSNG